MKAPTQAELDWWRWRRQGLDEPRGSAAEILARSGWMRSVGGAGPYLGLFARGRLSRGDVDAAVGALAIHELPSARGCTYVVPAADYAVALRASQGHGDAATVAMAKKYLGVTDQEIERLCKAIVDALDKAPLDPKGLKEALGGAVRHLGDEGKKRGTTTTLSLGLGLLQSGGEIRRVPEDGRLDRQRYRYARWKSSPLGKTKLVKLTPEDVQRFLNQKANEGLSPRTVSYNRAVLRKALNQALKWGEVTRNAATLVARPRFAGTKSSRSTPTRRIASSMPHKASAGGALHGRGLDRAA